KRRTCWNAGSYRWRNSPEPSNCEAEDGESNEPGPSRRQPRRRAEFYGKFDLDKFTDEDVRL
ncbi:unnamed protein product, partial [Nesidiocoris tenuis]